MPSNTPIEPTRSDREMAVTALLSETGMKYAKLEHPGHLVCWTEDADATPLTRVMGLRPEHLTRVAQAIAEARAAGRVEGEQQALSLLNAIDDLSGCLDNALETMPPQTLPYVQFHAAAEAVRVGRALLEKYGR
jgi:hypothetical protein